MQIFRALLLFIFPTPVVRLVVNAIGGKIDKGVRVGFSLVSARRLYLGAGCRIGHGSVIRIDRLVMRSGAYIGHMNFCTGPIDMWLGNNSGIGNRNIVSRAPRGVTLQRAQLKLGTWAKITASHKIDCTMSVLLGDYTTLAGQGSQVWTHGYVHADEGAGRYRVDGRVVVGNNVYIGSRALILAGILIADKIVVGAGLTVSRNLLEPGFYVSAPMRTLPVPAEPSQRSDLQEIDRSMLLERVFVRLK
ncbi:MULTISPECIES: acyltransferase [Sphingobium]|uniref:acyltransferase n=1 Tax=Sphingobium TaxID=165695 RepID=UPI000A929097|nr:MULTISPECIES: DapH/DapD/GlmU-related protein [Sphingobium]